MGYLGNSSDPDEAAALSPEQAQNEFPRHEVGDLFGIHVLRRLTGVEFPQGFQEFRLAWEYDRIGVVAKRSMSLHATSSETMCILF